MKDYIKLEKLWQDNELIELNVECSSSVAFVKTKIYVSNSLIDDLVCQISRFLDGQVSESIWENEEKGSKSTACTSFRFIRKDNLGHILIEVYAEIDDGGNYDRHNCCFYIPTEVGLLTIFGKRLTEIKHSPVGFVILLNDY